MLHTVLVANRGEIACRIIRTAKQMGVQTVAVYSDVDLYARHVSMADEAIGIGPAPAADSYLNQDSILKAAHATGTDAIHPGYGFLSENPTFAQACENSGLTFIGPSASTIRTMADKARAKQLVGETGVPVLNGCQVEDQTPAGLLSAAAQIDFPLMIKPMAGGGGKGIRVAWNLEELRTLIPPSQREARAAFGDDRLLLERYLTRSRHIEVQVFADRLGNTIHLFERDCSIQRRYQKVIEEAPARNLSPELRQRLTEAAVMVAKTIDYRGAGTVEFLIAGSEFYFMEMNTRLQVEHPVTEMTTGIDLVEWQIRIAAGEALPRKQDEIHCQGHAVEARLYAEDTRNNFLPSVGRLAWLRFPEESRDIRVDTGVRQGDQIGLDYDPMIAKIIVHDSEPTRCWNKLERALGRTGIAGLKTNLTLLRRISSHEVARCGDIDTGFLDRYGEDLLSGDETEQNAAAALAAFCLWRDGLPSGACQRRPLDPYSPWSNASGWRMNLPPELLFSFQLDGKLREISCRAVDKSLEVDISGQCYRVSGTPAPDNALRVVINGRCLEGVSIRSGSDLLVGVDGTFYTICERESGRSSQPENNSGMVTATMTGKVIQILAKPGDEVAKGDTMVIMEAMKMEHSLTAPISGKVQTLDAALNQLVEQGQILVTILPTNSAAGQT